jgi:hypothetical protein
MRPLSALSRRALVAASLFAAPTVAAKKKRKKKRPPPPLALAPDLPAIDVEPHVPVVAPTATGHPADAAPAVAVQRLQRLFDGVREAVAARVACRTHVAFGAPQGSVDQRIRKDRCERRRSHVG